MERLPHLSFLCLFSLLSDVGLKFKTFCTFSPVCISVAALSAAITAARSHVSSYRQGICTKRRQPVHHEISTLMRESSSVSERRRKNKKLKWKAKMHKTWQLAFFPTPFRRKRRDKLHEQLVIKDEAPLINMHVVLAVQLDCPKTWKLAAERCGAC